jgi:hypothetical protein
LVTKHESYEYWQYFNNFSTDEDIEIYLRNLEITNSNLQICFENKYDELAM